MAATPQVSVNIIRAFEGPRHSTLEFLWDCIAEHESSKVRLSVFDNPKAQLSHAECYKRMWVQALAGDERYVLLTEFDFLPDLKNWLPLHLLCAKTPVLVAEYCTRHGAGKIMPHGIPGAWYVLADKKLVGDPTKPLDFSPASIYNDPANGLHVGLGRDYKAQCLYLNQVDCMPRHYGTKMLTGEHLFWSRHLHDDPMQVVAGCQLGDIQTKHDIAVASWARAAPASLRRIITDRLLCTVKSESCSSSTPATSSSTESGNKSLALVPVPTYK